MWKLLAWTILRKCLTKVGSAINDDDIHNNIKMPSLLYEPLCTSPENQVGGLLGRSLYDFIPFYWWSKKTSRASPCPPESHTWTVSRAQSVLLKPTLCALFCVVATCMPEPWQSFPCRCFLVLVTISPRAEVSCRRWGCRDGEAEPICMDPGEAQAWWGGQGTDWQW